MPIKEYSALNSFTDRWHWITYSRNVTAAAAAAALLVTAYTLIHLIADDPRFIFVRIAKLDGTYICILPAWLRFIPNIYGLTSISHNIHTSSLGFSFPLNYECIHNTDIDIHTHICIYRGDVKGRKYGVWTLKKGTSM